MVAKLGSGARFNTLANKVAKSYEKKGMSPAKAEQAGKATAAKIGRRKYGKKRMGELSAAGRK